MVPAVYWRDEIVLNPVIPPIAEGGRVQHNVVTVLDNSLKLSAISVRCFFA